MSIKHKLDQISQLFRIQYNYYMIMKNNLSILERV
jgi:hypothetical protein